MPSANTEAMQHHLDEIARSLAPKAHAVVVLDQAGWHTTGHLRLPENLSLLPLPPKSPELNPVENVWQFLRQNKFSNRIFGSYEAIVAAACDAWNSLLADPARVTSIGTRQWATIAPNLGRLLLALWISNNGLVRMTTRGPAIACSRRPIRRMHHGISYAQTTRRRRGSTAFRIC